MKLRASSVLIVGGTVIAVVGAIVAVVYFFQPWRTCPDDDAPAGCPMLPEDAAVLYVALVGIVVGLAVAFAAAAIRGRRR